MLGLITYAGEMTSFVCPRRLMYFSCPKRMSAEYLALFQTSLRMHIYLGIQRICQDVEEFKDFLTVSEMQPTVNAESVSPLAFGHLLVRWVGAQKCCWSACASVVENVGETHDVCSSECVQLHAAALH